MPNHQLRSHPKQRFKWKPSIQAICSNMKSQKLHENCKFTSYIGLTTSMWNMHNAAMFSVPLSNKQWIMEPYQRKRQVRWEIGMHQMIQVSSGPEFTSLRPFPKLVKCHVSRPCTSKNSFRHNSWEDGIFRSIPKIDIRYFLWESFGMSMDISVEFETKVTLMLWGNSITIYIYILTATIKSSFFSIGILFPTHPIAKPTKYQPPQEIRPSLSLNHPLNKGLVSGGGVALAGWP